MMSLGTRLSYCHEMYINMPNFKTILSYVGGIQLARFGYSHEHKGKNGANEAAGITWPFIIYLRPLAQKSG